MNKPISPSTGTGLRQRLIEDMSVRGFSKKTRHEYVRIVAGFAAFLGRSPDTATAEDIRRFQLHQSELGMHAPAMNGTVAALRFFFTLTLDRPDISRKLIRLRYPRVLVENRVDKGESIDAFPMRSSARKIWMSDDSSALLDISARVFS
jgi:integrase/recombinase XerD